MFRFRKLLLTAASVLSVALVLPGCGGTSNTTHADCETSHTGASGSIKVGLVTDVGGLNDKSFNHLACVGVTKAAYDMSITTSVTQSTTPNDYVPNLTNYASQKYDLVIAVGFLMNDALVQVAQANPTTHFAIIDDVLTDKNFNTITPPLKNVAELIFREQEAGALVGYLAAESEADGSLPGLQKKGIISTLGGLQIPPVNHYINGYIWGAHQADKDTNKTTKVLVSWMKQDPSTAFTDKTEARQHGDTDTGNGSDFLFQVDGGAGLGYLDAANAKSVYGIGVDADQNYLGSYVIASALKRVDTAVYDTAKMVKDGTFDSTIGATPIQYFNIANDGIGYSANTNVPAAIKTKVDAMLAQIKSGALSVPEDASTDATPKCGTVTNPC